MKTVYILGAGFSVGAGAPTQANLMKEAVSLYLEDPDSFDKKQFKIFKDFIVNQLNVHEDKIADVEIEDIFTPLDRCLSESAQFRGIELGKIMKVREAIFHVIGTTIRSVLDRTQNSKNYIDLFARYLIKKSSIRNGGLYKNEDPVSVISTNWDILLDNSLYEHINNFELNAVVDYCCYISSKDENDPTIMPGLEKLGMGGFNVKLLKLHGSLNWLQCPRCMRIYCKFFRKQAVDDIKTRGSCRHCDRNFKEEKGRHWLISNLIMPTFIKDLSNPQYKIIWQNAGIEIAEADKLVFIGYSLPSADFEMRQLLSRMTRSTAEIEVVDLLKPAKRDDRKKHWQSFFGKRKVNFYFDGAVNYINKNLK